ncbi:MAG: glycosyltransferase [archaeon]|nr:glycosyltransferase [archaeon]
MISVVIPTYNEERNIVKCLKSLNNQSIPRKDYEIIIVDGKSTDRTVEIAKKYVKKIITQKPSDPFGIEGARHLGFLQTKYDLIATTDADCRVPKTWLENIIETLRQEKCVCVYGPLKLYGKYNFLERMNFLQELGSFFNVHYTIGANTAFVKKYYFKCGGYSDFGAIEDWEISFRIRKHGSIKYNKKMYIYYSTRRLEKLGFIGFSYDLLRNFANRFILKKRISNYAKQKYDS